MKKVCCVLAVVLLSAAAVAQAVYLSGDQPATNSTTTTGTNATAPLFVKPVKGGNDSVASGTGGVGSSPSISAGDGGDGTAVAGNGIGGTGGSQTLGTGSGGASGSSALNGANGGDVSINLGAAGTYAGAGTPGRNGALFLSSPLSAIPGGQVSSPLLCGPTFNGICFWWEGAAPDYPLVAWRDFKSGANQVSAGMDDQGTRYSIKGAVRFLNGSNLTTSLFDACLVDDGSGTNTLAISAPGTGNCGSPSAKSAHWPPEADKSSVLRHGDVQ